MKKLIALTLALLLALSLTACKDPDIRGEYVGDPTTATNSTTPTENAFDIGKVEANKYVNKFVGISCELGTDWTYMTDAEIRKNKEAALGAMGDDYAEAIENATTFTDMMATHKNQTDTVNITFEKLTGVNTLMSEEKYAEASKDSLKGALESMGMTNVVITTGTAPFAGKDHSYVAVSAQYSGIPVYERMAVVKSSNYMVVIVACTWQTDTCLDILNTFKAA